MVKQTQEKKLILQVKKSNRGQKRVTIPKKIDIVEGDYVEVTKHE